MSDVERRNQIVEDHYRDNYELLVRRMRNRVGGYSIDLAEEVVQEAYSIALKYYKGFSLKKGSFDQWFSSVLNNTLNKIKNEERGRGVSYELDAHEDFEYLPEELVVLPEERERRFRNGLRVMIETEKLRDKVILSLFFFDGFKSREVAEFLNVNHNTVRQVINRFREKLVAAPVGII